MGLVSLLGFQVVFTIWPSTKQQELVDSLLPTFSPWNCGEVLAPGGCWIWRGEQSILSCVLWPSKDTFVLRPPQFSPQMCHSCNSGSETLDLHPQHLILQIMSCVWNGVLLLLALSASSFQEIKREKEGVRPMKTKTSNSSHQGKFGWVLGKWLWSRWITFSVWAQQWRGKGEPKPKVLGILSNPKCWKTFQDGWLHLVESVPWLCPFHLGQRWLNNPQWPKSKASHRYESPFVGSGTMAPFVNGSVSMGADIYEHGCSRVFEKEGENQLKEQNSSPKGKEYILPFFSLWSRAQAGREVVSFHDCPQSLFCTLWRIPRNFWGLDLILWVFHWMFFCWNQSGIRWDAQNQRSFLLILVNPIPTWIYWVARKERQWQ